MSTVLLSTIPGHAPVLMGAFPEQMGKSRFDSVPAYHAAVRTDCGCDAASDAAHLLSAAAMSSCEDNAVHMCALPEIIHMS